MICLQKNYLKLIMEKLNFSDIVDLIILNKFTICKNFYIMIKFIDNLSDINSETKDISQEKLLYICEKSLEHVLKNRKENLNLDSVSYFLFLTVYNM
jgi:hypothetical protein